MKKTMALRLAAAGLAAYFGTAAAQTAAIPPAGPTVAAQSHWPSKPIRLIQPFSAGGPGDMAARMFTADLAETLHQNIITENKPGAGGIVGSAYVANSPPDGYVILLSGNGAITTFLLRKSVPYAEKSLAPVTLLNSAPSIMVASPASGIRSLKDLQARGRTHNGITFGDAGAGSTGHFVAEMTQDALGVPVTPIHYKSGGESLTAVVGGQVDVASEAAIAVLPLVRSGRLVAIAVDAKERLPALPDVPTSTEQGFGAIQMEHWTGVFAPAATPPAILDAMCDAIQRTARDPKLKASFEAYGYRLFDMDRTGFRSFLDAERDRLAKIVSATGMTAD